MASANKVILIGNLTYDPRSKQLPSGTTVTEFGLALNRKYRTQAGEEKEEVTFVDCSAFARQGEVIAQYCTKGSPIYVEGRLKWDSWTDNDGGKRSKLSVVVENFQFLNSRQSGGGADYDDGGSERPTSRAGRAERQSRGPAPERAADGGRGRDEMPFGDEKVFSAADIPF